MHGRRFCLRWIIRGWPGPSADGLGPRLAPNNIRANRGSLDVSPTPAPYRVPDSPKNLEQPNNTMPANEQICSLTKKFSIHNLTISSKPPTQPALQPKLQTNSTNSLASAMASTTTTPSEPTHIVETYHAIESRTTQTIEVLQA